MSKGMKTLRVNSGEISCFVRAGLTGLITINSTIDLWELPTGAMILDSIIFYTVQDTTVTADVVVESTEAAPRTFNTLDISAASINQMTKTAALLAPIAGTVAQRKLRLRNTAAGTGNGTYTVVILATRPGPEPQASA